MRGLIIFCFVALAVAAPQGYYYNSQTSNQHFGPGLGTNAVSGPNLGLRSGFGSGVGLGIGSGIGSGIGFGFGSDLGSRPGTDVGSNTNYGVGSGYSSVLSSGIGSRSGYDQSNRGAQVQHQQPLIFKRFFIHSAPEEDEVEFQHKDIVVGQPRKNFNVVFIKSPVTAVQKTKVRVLPAVNDEKTVIYVLSKKAGENEVIAHVEEPQTTTTKPEVFFIKYKTNEEAQHAQNTIQAEYDRLGGSSVILNEGFAPISSAIGSLDGHSTSAGSGGHSAVNTAYLPPVKKQQE